MLDRFFGEGCFGGGLWVVILFFLFLAFGDCWGDIEIHHWIPFLILLLILCCCNGMFE